MPTLSLRLPVLLLTGSLLAGGCSSKSPAPGGEADTTATASASTGADAPQVASTDSGWISLDDLSQWRGFKKDHVPTTWTTEDGAITLNRAAGSESGDLITRQEFGDFDLELDWKISEGGNSGIIYRVGESEDQTYQTGPEMQVIDNERHADAKIPSHRAGALYDLIVPPEGIAKPAGEWNHARLRVEGNHIQQWLNGTSTADIVMGTPEWKKAIEASKFRTMDAFASLPRGYIALQDHGGDRVWFRNIRIRPLDAGR
jgi:hypothetical protein